MTDGLVLLKFGGSLITEKSAPNTANLQQIDALAKELKYIYHSKTYHQLLSLIHI